MSSVISLNWPSALRPLTKFHQNQFSLPITGPVECVTTTISTARNILNELLAFQTGKPILSDLSVQDYIHKLDELHWWGLVYRVPTQFPDLSLPWISKEKLNPRGFMLPRSQAIFALKRIADELKKYYGISFRIRQTAGNTFLDIAENLQRGNLVLISGLYDAAGKEQNLLGGGPHTFGPVIEVNFNSSTITLVDTGAFPVSTSSFDDFLQFWGRKSLLNLYTKPYTMTVLIPDLVSSP